MSDEKAQSLLEQKRMPTSELSAIIFKDNERKKNKTKTKKGKRSGEDQTKILKMNTRSQKHSQDM